ncbi:MAG TPA: hypothetical protein VK968_13585, partial [Roseimicrobium sp.]|nr:hypothetical protein [Roseimicrobium sp.]
MDRSKRLVTIYRRSWWFVRRFDIVSYDSIEDFGFWSKDLPQFCASEPFWGDKYEYVWLVLKIRDRDDLVRLISFEGEGSKETGLLGVVLGDSIFDFRGDHVEAAYDAKAMVESALSR